MEISEINPPGRQVIERYGPGGFRIAGVTFTGPVLVFPDRTLDWDVADIARLTPEALRPAADHGGIEILLIGTGRSMKPVPRPVRDALRQLGITVDAMDTGAACRTYSVLLGEGRRVAAGLLPLRA
jgi:uncharacterized protein